MLIIYYANLHIYVGCNELIYILCLISCYLAIFNNTGITGTKPPLKAAPNNDVITKYSQLCL